MRVSLQRNNHYDRDTDVITARQMILDYSFKEWHLNATEN
jgi:hypothetical protein